MDPSKEIHPSLISALMQPDCYQHPVSGIELVETHISWVILTGNYAYKIKKPVNLGFLDFSTLDQRRFFCQEELRLNRRLAPDIYLSVVTITGTDEQPGIDGDGNTIEYAVKMRQFSRDSQLDQLFARNELRVEHLEQIAQLIADFHQNIDIAGTDTSYGDPDHIRQPVEENFTQIRERISDAKQLDQLSVIQEWSLKLFERLLPVFIQRKRDGFIRECHGDMHLRNMVLHNGAPLLFDCIEFNPNIRWIDVINEIAFMVMDMQDRGQDRLAWHFLNSYLENTGDYAGIAVLPYYLIYRAMVLAKVHAIRANQPGIAQEQKTLEEKELSDYLKLALRYTDTPSPRLIITHGLPASGKSTLTTELLENLGAIRLRSDVERKRLFALKKESDQAAGFNQGIYTTEATLQTYDRLAGLADHMLDAGYTVIVDANFSEPAQRDQFHTLATRKKMPFFILDITASPATLRERILSRKTDVSDADIMILEQKLTTWSPLSEHETDYVIPVDTEVEVDIAPLVAMVKTDS